MNFDRIVFQLDVAARKPLFNMAQTERDQTVYANEWKFVCLCANYSISDTHTHVQIKRITFFLFRARVSEFNIIFFLSFNLYFFLLLHRSIFVFYVRWLFIVSICFFFVPMLFVDNSI